MGPVLLLWLVGCSDFELEEVKQTVPEGLRDLTVEPGEVDFGVLATTTPTAQTVRITSVGDAPITVSNVDVAGSSAYQITWASTATTLNPGDSADVLVTYTPQSFDDQASLSVYSNGVDPIVSVPLFGAGTFPAIRVDPSSLHFQSNAGEPVTLTAEVQSIGTADLVVSTSVLEGAQFSAVVPTPFTLAPGDHTTLEVTYTPSAEGETVSGNLWLGTNTVSGYALVPLEAHEGPVCIGLGEAWDRGLLEVRSDNTGMNVLFENLSADEDICIDRWYVLLADNSQDLGAGDMEFDVGGDYPSGTLTIAPGDSLRFKAAAPTDSAWWCLELDQYMQPNMPYQFTGARVFDPVLGNMTGQNQQAIWDYQDAHPLLIAGRVTNYVEVPTSGGTAAIELRPFNMGSADGTGELRETLPAGWSADDVDPSPSRVIENSDGSTTLLFDLDLVGRVHGGSNYSATWYDEVTITYTLSAPACVGRQYLPVMETRWTDADGEDRTDNANPLVVNCVE